MDGAIRARLTTTGRVTGRPHTVTLRGVLYRDSFYFSRHRPDSDWFLNALAVPEVTITWDGRAIPGVASLVDDDLLERRVSSLKYPGDSRSEEKRVVIRVVPI